MGLYGYQNLKCYASIMLKIGSSDDPDVHVSFRSNRLGKKQGNFIFIKGLSLFFLYFVEFLVLNQSDNYDSAGCFG